MLIKTRNEIQDVYDLFDKIEIPDKDIFIIKDVNNVPNYYRGFPNFRLLSNLSHKQEVLLAQLVSEKTGKTYKLPSCQSLYNYFNTDEMLLVSNIIFDDFYGFWNKEVIFKDGAILPDPKVVEKDGKLIYEGVSIKSKIKKDVVGTLKAAGLLKTKAEKPIKYNKDINFEDECFSCVKSYFVGSGLYVSTWPDGSTAQIAVLFENEGRQKERIEVAKEEYENLLKDSERLKKMKPIIDIIPNLKKLIKK